MTVPTAALTSTGNGVGLLCDGPSFADALALIGAAKDLTRGQRCHWATSLRAMARYLRRPREIIPARIAAISNEVRKLRPEELGAKAKTFANHRANVRSALLWCNHQSRGTGHAAPMACHYRHLLAQIENRHLRDFLSPFFRYLSAIGVDPVAVADVHVEDYASFKKRTSFGTVSPTNLRRLIRYWNEHSRTIPDWPQHRLTEPHLLAVLLVPAGRNFPKACVLTLRPIADVLPAVGRARQADFCNRVRQPLSQCDDVNSSRRSRAPSRLVFISMTSNRFATCADRIASRP